MKPNRSEVVDTQIKFLLGKMDDLGFEKRTLSQILSNLAPSLDDADISLTSITDIQKQSDGNYLIKSDKRGLSIQISDDLKIRVLAILKPRPSQ